GMAEILYTGLHSNEEKILKAIDAYVRTEFLYTLYQSHLLANENIFKAPLPPIKLLRRAIEERTGIGELWGRYRSNVDSLRDFYERISKRGKGNADTGQWELKSLFDGMDRNIKIFASYPHMMILFHIISDSPSRHGIGVDFDMGYMGSHGIVQLDSRNLMGPLFRGEQEPLFNYSKDMIKSNGFEMLYSFDFALRTHLFSVTGIDPDVFVAQVVRRFSGPNLNLVRDSLDLMKQRLRSSQDYKNFIKLCKTSEKSTSLATPHSIDLMELKYSPYFGNLILLSTVGVGDRGEMIIPGSGGLGKKALGFNYFDSTYSEAIEVARVDLASSLRLGRAMKSSYVSYLKEVFQLSDQEILSRTKNTEKVLNELSSLREEILNETKMRYKESGPCFYQSLVKDAKIQSEVLKAEQAYLRQVYREITELRNERTPEARRQDIE
ncbi:MAG: hypothetical protein KDD35_12025, partial [Bdellovibrionales bacterium]|nr:hypothetical protein [Bdellovibrionales bacterium]